MFDTHQKQIGTFARQSPENMGRVAQFVLCTIQQSLFVVPQMMEDIDKEGSESKWLWGFKRDAFDYWTENRNTIYKDALAIYDGYSKPAIQAKHLLAYFADLPGLGLVKAGFMVQLCFGLSGCLDMHNIERFGLNPNRFKASRFKYAKRPATRKAIIAEYSDLVRYCGGTRGLWDDWCNYVADRNPNDYKNGFEVSAVHCEALGI